MRVVVYDAEDFEPITVIDVPADLFERATKSRQVCFPVYPPLSAVMEPDEFVRVTHCRLQFEPVFNGERLGGRRPFMWIATTPDGETALLMRAAFLPGQRGEINRQLRNAFLHGLMTGLAA